MTNSKLETNNSNIGPDSVPDEKKIQNHFGIDEIRDVVEKSIIAKRFEPIDDEHYRELTFHGFLFSYLNEEDDLVFVYFDYNEDNIQEFEFRDRKLMSLGHYNRDLLLVSFFGVD